MHIEASLTVGYAEDNQERRCLCGGAQREKQALILRIYQDAYAIIFIGAEDDARECALMYKQFN